jgi:hypothetical protein
MRALSISLLFLVIVLIRIPKHSHTPKHLGKYTHQMVIRCIEKNHRDTTTKLKERWVRTREKVIKAE